MITFRTASATDAGRVRQVNQDVALTSEQLVAVADGMGGHAAGDVAAKIAIDSLEHTVTPEGGPESLIDGTLEANRAVYEEAVAHPEMRGMGTTLTAAAVVDVDGEQRICLINVGDSRAYLLEEGQLSRLTEDHSLVEQLVRQGELTEEEAAVHPHRHILTRALGIDLELEVDSSIFAPVPRMRLLLCSDGLTNECTEAEIATVLRDYDRPEDAAAHLVERAIAHGGNDNVTAVVVDVLLGEPSQPARVTAAEADPLVYDVPGALARPRATVRAAQSDGPEPLARRSRATSEMPRTKPARIIPRVVLFVIVFVGVLGGIAGITYSFDRATYFVGLDHGYVAVYEGRPKGMLWFQPTLITRTKTPASGVLDENLPLLRSGILESSYDDAVTTANDLANEKSLLGIGAPNPTTTTTTTTTIVVATTAPTTTIAPTTTTTAPSRNP